MQRKTAVGTWQAIGLLLILTTNLLAADPLDNWVWRNPLPNGINMNAVAYGNGLIVGVGDLGTIMTTPELDAQWWVQSPAVTDQNLKAIAYSPDNGTFVAVGNASGTVVGSYKMTTILTSTDGTNWYSQLWTNVNTRSLYGVAYGVGLFVAVGQRAEIWTSPDGTNWTQQVSPQTGSSYNLNAITYRPDIGFAAVGDANSSVAQIMTSPDGINWTLQNVSVPAYSLNAVTWGYVTNGDSSVTTNFLTVGGKSGTIGTVATSPDGILWTTQFSAPGFDVSARLYGTAFKPGVGYIAVGQYGTIQYSADGTNWNSGYSDLSLPGNDFGGATYVADLDYFVAVGNYGEVETSPTGEPGTWTGEFSGRPENLYSIARGHDNFVAVGLTLAYPPNYAIILTSRTGSGWRVRNSTTPNKLTAVAYGAGNFVAVSNAGTIVTSDDEGTNWTLQAAGLTGANLAGVSYITNSVTNLFLATGASGTLATSPDGTNWTLQASGSANNLYCACPTYAAGAYVVGGASGTGRGDLDPAGPDHHARYQQPRLRQ